jgi:hypothetical protein
MTRPGKPSGRLFAWCGLMFGTSVSVAANILAARVAPDNAPKGWEPPVAAQLGAGVWPLALLLAVEVLTRVRWQPGTGWLLARYGGAGLVATGAFIISYGHIYAVLADWGYHWVGAGTGPLVVDGLMVISGFALLSDSAQPAPSARRVPRQPTQARAASPTKPTPDAAVDEVAARRERDRLRKAAWRAEQRKAASR